MLNIATSSVCVSFCLSLINSCKSVLLNPFKLALENKEMRLKEVQYNINNCIFCQGFLFFGTHSFVHLFIQSIWESKMYSSILNELFNHKMELPLVN